LAKSSNKKRASDKSEALLYKEQKFVLPKDVVLPRNMTSLDKIRKHLVEGSKGTLSPKLESLKKVYIHANQLLLHGFSKQETVNTLHSQLGLSIGHCYEIVRNAMDLFGDAHKSTKEGLRQIVIDNLWRVYRRAIDAGDLREQNIAMKNIASIGGLYNPNQEIDWSKLIIPMPVFTTDPQVLKDQQRQTIDITGDELDDEP
jgi:hypothetical protein